MTDMGQGDMVDTDGCPVGADVSVHDKTRFEPRTRPGQSVGVEVGGRWVNKHTGAEANVLAVGPASDFGGEVRVARTLEAGAMCIRPQTYPAAMDSGRSDMPTAAELRAEAERARTLLGARESGLLAIVWTHDVVHAGYVADALGLTPQAANNHLMRLVRIGFLKREAEKLPAGGRSYAYSRS